MSDTPLITAAELAKHLSCARGTVYAMRRRGDIPAVRLGRTYRFSLDDVMTALQAPPRPWQQSNRSIGRKRA